MEDQKMKRIKLLPATGAVLAMALTAPFANADVMSPEKIGEPTPYSAEPLTPSNPIVNPYLPIDLPSSTLAPEAFLELFEPMGPSGSYNGTLKSLVQMPFANIEADIINQVFQGRPGTIADGVFAYAYQINSRTLNGGNKQFKDLEGVRMAFNSTPLNTRPVTGSDGFVAQITGPVGDLKEPTLANGALDVPGSFQFQRSSDENGNLIFGSLTATFTPRLTPGKNSSIFAVFTNEAPEELATVNIRGGEFVTTPDGQPPLVVSPKADAPLPPPIPEPSTILAWAGMLGAALAARRYRRRRAD